MVGTGSASVTVVFKDLAIKGGDATDGGILGGPDAMGGGEGANPRAAIRVRGVEHRTDSIPIEPGSAGGGHPPRGRFVLFEWASRPE